MAWAAGEVVALIRAAWSAVGRGDMRIDALQAKGGREIGAGFELDALGSGLADILICAEGAFDRAACVVYEIAAVPAESGYGKVRAPAPDPMFDADIPGSATLRLQAGIPIKCGRRLEQARRLETFAISGPDTPAWRKAITAIGTERPCTTECGVIVAAEARCGSDAVAIPAEERMHAGEPGIALRPLV